MAGPGTHKEEKKKKGKNPADTTMIMGPALLLVVGVILVHAFAESSQAQHQTSVILLGATGDLARKYLWQVIWRPRTRLAAELVRVCWR